MEKKGYRENIEYLGQLFPGRACLSMQEAADAIGVHYNTLRNGIRDIPHQKVSRHIVIPVVGLARWLSEKN